MLRRTGWITAVLFALLIDWLFLQRMTDRYVDFPQFYFAGELVAAGKVGQIYDTSAYVPLMKAVPIRLGEASVYFNRPAFAALLCWPLAWFSFHTAQQIFIAINFGLWGLLVWKLPVWFRAPSYLRVPLLCFYPFAFSAGLRQDTLALTLLVGWALGSLLRRDHALAGIVLSLALIKPHLVLLVPVFLLVNGKLRALYGFVGAAVALGLLSFGLVGVPGISQWLALLAAPTTDYMPETMGNLRGLGLAFGTPLAIGAGLGVAACLWAVWRHGSIKEQLTVFLITSLLISPHTYKQDYAYLAIVALISLSPWVRYSILIPWYFFWPGQEMYPMLAVVLMCLAINSFRGMTSTWGRSLRTVQSGNENY